MNYENHKGEEMMTLTTFALILLAILALTLLGALTMGRK